ncbi:MAG: hypothetical protein EU541_04995 [Promethearchaeota archaeon]|nr:MAG: hypothetical protein EU541_04995 [Candidatus Lokiarchaeota archaeon]
MEHFKKDWATKLLVYVIFIFIVAVAAKVDWVAEHSVDGLLVRYFWLGILISLGLILPLLFMYLAGNKIREKSPEDKKWFIVALVLFAIGNGIPIIFYVVLEQSPGFFLFLQLALFGLVPAFIFQPEKLKVRLLILLILFLCLVIPLGIFVDLTISDLWANPAMDKTMYYLAYWGLFSVFLYLVIAIGWKFGGGSRRESWNVYIAGMLVHYSTMEDFFYFLLNGQPLPGEWPWLRNFVINLEALFGHVPTDVDLLIFCLILNVIALFILFDVHGYIWKIIRK